MDRFGSSSRRRLPRVRRHCPRSRVARHPPARPSWAGRRLAEVAQPPLVPAQGLAPARQAAPRRAPASAHARNAPPARPDSSARRRPVPRRRDCPHRPTSRRPPRWPASRPPCSRWRAGVSTGCSTAPVPRAAHPRAGVRSTSRESQPRAPGRAPAQPEESEAVQAELEEWHRAERKRTPTLPDAVVARAPRHSADHRRAASMPRTCRPAAIAFQPRAVRPVRPAAGATRPQAHAACAVAPGPVPIRRRLEARLRA